LRQPNRERRHSVFSGLRTVIFVLFAIFFTVPLLWLVLATTKGGQQLTTQAPLSWGSIHQLVTNWHRLTSFEGDAYAGWFGNTVEYAGTSLVIVLLVDIPAGYGLAISLDPRDGLFQ
jgi:multiple sugar transport system permease protein